MKHHTIPDVIAALNTYKYILGLRMSDIIPEQLYRLTTYDRMPALQADPKGKYFGMYGAEIIEFLNKSN